MLPVPPGFDHVAACHAALDPTSSSESYLGCLSLATLTKFAMFGSAGRGGRWLERETA